MLRFSQLPDIANGKVLNLAADANVSMLITDSRKAVASPEAVFFAIKGVHHDGHAYIKQLYQSGVRQFVIEHNQEGFTKLKDCNMLQVNSSLDAIQKIAAYHRSKINVPVIGITGSNGKTIIKEWLYQLLSPEFKIAKNPGSYNSQLGVPLSVWQLEKHHQLGIFEAGISQPGEMEKLQSVIQPTIGLFTNIGPAHDEGFASITEKISEKLKLFSSAEKVIYCRDHEHIHGQIQQHKIPALSWGVHPQSDIRITKNAGGFLVDYISKSFTVALPFNDAASIENSLHCVAVMLYLGFSDSKINERMSSLRSIPMRLELKEGINQCQVVDDTYNNDLAGLQISLDFLSNQHQKKKKRLILSDILQSGLSEKELAQKIGQTVSSSNLNAFVGVGRILSAHREFFPKGSHFFESTEEFLKNFDWESVQQEIILVKGARPFAFEKIVNRLQKKLHGTVMEIDLGAVVHNLNFFKGRLKPTTKIMVMVKALAYGSGSTEIANVLQYHQVDYLGVAYADEGVELRKNNITLPVMVMNPSEETFETLMAHQLEPEIYSFRILDSFLKFLNGRKAKVHLKVDTGMHRLGFDESDLKSLIEILKNNLNLTVSSIFSHLAGADEQQHDNFSRMQGEKFSHAADEVSKALGYKPLYHILNSPGILRLPELQFDMVRLGIGLYGIDPTAENISGLKPVATLKTTISQIKHIKTGETIGYGRRSKAERELKIATIAIGYADGFSRAFSRGAGKVLIHGKLVSVIGNVCMDMTMTDITDVEAKEGDEVIIFGTDLPIQKVAESINTIPYEILTNTSERVKRVFVAESI